MLGLSPGVTDLILAVLIVTLIGFMVYNHWKADKPKSAQGDSVEINIKDLIVGVKTALGDVERERLEKKESAMFEVRDFDLELNFVVKRASTATGGIEAKVVTLGSEKQYSQEEIQKIKLHLATLPAKEETGKSSPVEIRHDNEVVIGEAPPLKRATPWKGKKQ